MENFGDRLYLKVKEARGLLFMQGELAQLTYQSYVKFIDIINESGEDTIQISYPVGYRADRKSIEATQTYSKESLIERYQYLGLTQLPINGLYQLITIVETLMGDILRETLIEYPIKISNKRKLDAEIVLSASSLDEIKIAIINSILNEIAYKSPKEFAEEFKNYISINLLEKPTYHKYIEIKATRDIHIHNSGIANNIYLIKADTLARVKTGDFLPVDIQYFLESYECCLQLTEILEESLNKIWPSAQYRIDKQALVQIEDEKELAVEKALEKAEEVVVTKTGTLKQRKKKKHKSK
jgi:hypothetical protein